MMVKLNNFFGRFIQYLHLGVKGHLLNPFWYSREKRRRIRYEATSSSVLTYLNRYADFVKNINPCPQTSGNEKEYAFTIWFQGEENAPELVKACFRSMRRNLNLELIVLDEKNLFEWISLPDYIINKWRAGKIKHTQFSDICRVELLYEHGGLWLDATDFMTSPVPSFIMDLNVFMFQAGERIRGSYAMIQSCFIRSKKHNPLLGVWREAIFEYWRHEDSKIDYFVHHLLLKLAVTVNDTALLEFDKMPKIIQDPTHELWYDHVEDSYDENEFERLTSQTFFQKTNYKDKRLNHLKPGTMAHFIIKNL